MGKEIEQLYDVKINIPGGVIAVGDFVPLLEALAEVGITDVRIGMRQQLLFKINEQQLSDLEYTLMNDDLVFEVAEDRYPNIVTSYVADEIFNVLDWVQEGVYKDILDSFDYNPRLKVNVTDAAQSFVPYYSGHLNFISSSVSHHWYLFVRFPRTNVRYCWGSLVYSYDIPVISKVLEDLLLTAGASYVDDNGRVDGARLEHDVQAVHRFHTQEYDRSFVEAEFLLPYYEGFNRYHAKYWLGVYRRNGLYAIDFLQDMVAACQKCGVTQIYTTPWRSLIIKQIDPSCRHNWDVIMDKYRINLRHASNELNWQLEDQCQHTLDLKKEVVRYFNEFDVRTYKLCFGVKMTAKSGVWGSVVLRGIAVDSPDTEMYDVEYTAGFNPHAAKVVTYRQGVKRVDLGPVLVELCDLYYDQQVARGRDVPVPAKSHEQADQEEWTAEVFQCPYCLSLYDPRYGDESIGVGIQFVDLPVSYSCYTCGTPKADFILFQKVKETF